MWQLVFKGLLRKEWGEFILVLQVREMAEKGERASSRGPEVFLSGGTLSSPRCLRPADPTQPRLAGKRNFRLSVFANQLPSPAKRQNRLLLITKKYYPLAGGSQQHEYPKQTDTVCLEAWCLVQLPCQIQAHRSSYSRSERGRRGWFVICMLQHHNSKFIFTSWLRNW